MKKLITLLVINRITICFLMISIVVASCTTDIMEPPLKDKLGITATPVTSAKIINQVASFVGSKSKSIYLNSGIEFDFSALQRVKRNGYEGEVILALQKNLNQDSEKGYQMAFFMENEKIKSAMLIKMERSTSEKLTLTYATLNGKKIQKVTIDNNTKTIKLDNNHNKFKGDCGQETADCIGTMYSDLGWGSVSWWIGTAIFGGPWVAGTVIGCAYASCIQ